MTTHAPRFYLIDRVIVALMGSATVPVLFVAARRLFTSEIGLIAAALLSIAFLHVRDSHFGITEVPATFMLVLAFAFMATRPLDLAHRWNVIAAALLCGLAASMKYNALAIVLPLLVLALNQEWRRTRSGRRLMVLLALVGTAAVLGFVVGTPYAVLDYPAFRNAMLFQRTHLAEGHGTDLGYGWTHHLMVSLPYGVGWPVLTAAVTGVLWLIAVDLTAAAVVLSFPVIDYAIIGSGRTVFVRYMVPLVPFVCLYAAIAISWVGSRIQARTRLGPAVGAVVVPALTVLVGSLSIARSIAFDRLLSLDDNRVVAARALETAFPSTTTVYQFGSEYARLQLPERFQTWIPDPALNPLTAPAAALPQLVVVPSSPLEVYTPPIAATIAEALRTRYRTLARFDVDIPGRNEPLVYDEQDAFFVPLTGFGRLRRPGPTIEIFERDR